MPAKKVRSIVGGGMVIDVGGKEMRKRRNCTVAVECSHCLTVMNTVGKFVAKVEAAASRNDSAKEVEPIGIPRCWTPEVILDWDP
jgi:hypothetical protein